MKAPVLYRVSSVLLVLFAIGHTLGFRKVDPRWNADAVVAAMQSVHFNVQGFQRSYWDFYVGFGLFATVFFLLSAAMAWQFGGMSRETLRSMRSITWSLALCFVVVTFLSWRFFFVAPVAFSSLVTLCLTLGAWLTTRPS